MRQRPWDNYNNGLLELSDRSTGIIYAPNTNHFIQKDNPQFVASQLELILQNIRDDIWYHEKWIEIE